MALVVGGSGKIGQKLVSELLRSNYYVAIVGSIPETNKSPSLNLFHDSWSYLSSANKTAAELATEVQKSLPENYENRYIFNLAWRGSRKLTDGSITDQIRNIADCEKWISLAKILGFRKYISAGTIEEKIIEMQLDLWPTTRDLLQEHKWYAFSKLYAAKMQNYLCYKLEIDHIQAQIGVVLGSHRSPVSYVDRTLSIMATDKREHYDEPRSKWPTTFASDQLIAKQLLYIAENGLNLDCFRLGSLEYGTIQHFLTEACRLINKHEPEWNLGIGNGLSCDAFNVQDIAPNLLPGAPTESMTQMLANFFS